MDQRLQKKLRADIDESWARQANHLEENAPETPMAALVIVMPQKAIDTFRQWMFDARFTGKILEHVVESHMYAELRAALKEAESIERARKLPMSAIVAVATLQNCWPTFKGRLITPTDEVRPDAHNALTGNFSDERFGWMLANIRALKNPVPARGQRGLWEVDAALQALIEKELP